MLQEVMIHTPDETGHRYHHGINNHSPPPWTFRPLGPSDIDEVKELCRRWFPVKYPEKWYVDITSKNRFYSSAAVSIETGCIMGFIVYDIKHHTQVNKEDSHLLAEHVCDDDSHVAYILSLGIVESSRRQNLGSILLSECVKYLDTGHKQVKAVYLHVLASNTAAIRFYEKHQFRRHLFLPFYYHIDGHSQDGCSYVLYINGGRPDYSPIVIVYVGWQHTFSGQKAVY